MVWLLVVAAAATALTVYVGVRQHRHPVPPGPRKQRHGPADPDSRDWLANEGGGLG